MLPRGTPETEAVWRIIVDPIDGTRGLMYQKRSAWILTGVAPNRGPETALKDIELAVQTEIPLVKQHLRMSCGRFAAKAQTPNDSIDLPASNLRFDYNPRPQIISRRATRRSFASFRALREVLAAIDEEIVARRAWSGSPGKAQCFEDQYTSTGGQLYELMSGHDRFTADMRAVSSR